MNHSAGIAGALLWASVLVATPVDGASPSTNTTRACREYTIDLYPRPADEGTRGSSTPSESCPVDAYYPVRPREEPNWTGYVDWLTEHGYPYYYPVSGDILYYLGGYYGARGWFKFDLSPIPDNAHITKAVVCLYQYRGGNGAECNIFLLDIDPCLASGQDIWNSFGVGTCEIEADGNPGWLEGELRSPARLEAFLQQDYVTFGVVNPVFPAAGAYGIGHGQYSPCLRLTYTGPGCVDLTAKSCNLLTYPICASEWDSVSCVVENLGDTASSEAVVSLWLDSAVVDTTTLLSVSPTRPETVRFALQSPTRPPAYVTVGCRASVPEDVDRLNDTSLCRTWLFPAGTYLAKSFEDTVVPPPGWVTFDNYAAGTAWVPCAVSWWPDNQPHAGYCFASARYESSRPVGPYNDDWLISDTVFPDSGHPDTLGFFYRVYRYYPPTGGPLQVWAMRGRAAADTIRRLYTADVFDTVYRPVKLSLDGFDGTAVYIGFRWPINQICGVSVDDIWLGVRPQVGGLVAETRTPVAAFALRPNPAPSGWLSLIPGVGVHGKGRLALVDVSGRVVQDRWLTLEPDRSITIDTRDLPAGVYAVRLQSEHLAATRKLVLLPQ